MTLRLLLAGLVGAMVLSSCGTDQEGTGMDDSAAQLSQQRLDVRARAVEILDHAERTLPGTTTVTSARYEGCESAFNDQYRTFHYLAQGRVDTDGVADPASLARVIAAAGLEPGETAPGPGGRQTVTSSSRDGVRASLSVVADNPWVLVEVWGPCVEVPREERDAWLNRSEPSPHLH